MRKVWKSILSLVLVLQLLVAPCSLLASATVGGEDPGTIIDVTDFGADPSGKGDSTIPIQEALAAAKELDGPVTLSFPKGEYHVYKDYASKRVYHTSNTGSLSYPEKSIGILIEDQENLTIEGNGSLFMMHGDIMAIAVVGSKNVKLQNFVLDYEVPNTMDTTVAGIGETEDGKPYMDMYIPANYHYSISQDQKHIDWTSELSPYTGEPYWTERDRLGPYLVIYKGYDETVRRHTASTTYEGANVLDADPFVGVESIVPQDDNVVRFTYKSRRPEAQEPGNVYLFSNSVTRKTAGAFIWESEQTLVKNIDVHYLAGFGWLTQMSKDTEFNGVNFLPRQGTGKYTTSNADQIHVAGAGGYFNVIDCNFSMSHDDPINIHGSYLRVEEVIDSKTLRLAYIHSQQGGFPAYHPGDQVMFYSRTHLESVAHVDENNFFTVASAIHPGEVYNGSKLSMKETVVTFDKDFSPEVLEALKVKIRRKAGDPEEPLYVAENVTYAPTVHIKGNVMRSIPTRGILCTTRNPVIVEDNVFENLAMASMYLSNDADYWYESGPIRDMTIRNNKFYVRTTGQREWDAAGPIYVDPVIIRSYIVSSGVEPTPKGDPVHRNINILDNEIHMGDYQVIVAEGVMGMKFQGNTVVRDNPNVKIQLSSEKTELGIGEQTQMDMSVTEQTLPKDIFVFKNCSNVELGNNTYDDGFKMNIRVTKNSAAVKPEELDGIVDIGDDPLTVNASSSSIVSAKDKVQYASSNPSVVKVDGDGNVMALARGEADVKAFYELNGTIVEAEPVHFSVTGEGTLLDSIAIQNPDDQTITEVGGTIAFTSEPSDAQWSVVDARTGEPTNAATISADGVLTASQDGIVKVIAFKSGASDSRTVMISTPESYGATPTSTKRVAARAFAAAEEPELASGFSIAAGTEVLGNLQKKSNTQMILTADQDGQISGKDQGTPQNLVLYDIPAEIAKDNFRVQVTIDGLPQTPYGGAALMLYNDTDNYISIGQKGHMGIVAVSESNGEYSERADTTGTKVEKASFEIEKNSNMIFVKFWDGSRWKVVSGYSAGASGLNDDDLKIAFYVNKQGSDVVKATYSNFRIASGSVSSDDLEKQDPVAFFGAPAKVLAEGFSFAEGTEVPENWICESSTKLTLTSDQDGQISGKDKGTLQNLVLYDIPAEIERDDFRVQVTIDGLPQTPYGGAALMLYNDTDNYISIGQKGHMGIVAVSESNGEYSERADTTGTKVEKASFEIEKNSNMIFVKFWDGSRWKVVSGYSAGASGLNDDDLKIAFYVNKQGSDVVKATYSNFRIASGSVSSDDLEKQEPIVISGESAKAALAEGFSFAEGTEEPKNWNSESATQLTLTSDQDGQISGKDKGTLQNLVLYDIPAEIERDDFRVQVTIDGLPQTPYGGAALMLYNDTDNYISIGQKGHMGIVAVSESNGEYSERADTTGTKVEKASFEIEKNSNMIFVKFWDGSRWKVVSGYSAGASGLNDDDLKIAFYVNKQGSDVVKATYSDFRIASGSVSSDALAESDPIAITTAEGGDEPDEPDEPKNPVLADSVSIWQDSNNWYPTGGRDELAVRAETGDLYASQSTARNTVMIDIPAEWKDDLRVQGTVAIDDLGHLINYANASMALMKDGDNYLSVGQKAHMGGIAIANEIGARTSEPSYPAIARSRVMTYEIEKSGNNIYLRCKAPDGEWQDINARNNPLINTALGNSFKLAFITWNKGAGYPLTCTYSGVKMAKASESTTESLEKQVSMTLVNAYPNTAPTVTDLRTDKDTYVVGDSVFVTGYNYADADENAIGKLLYKWQYTKNGKTETTYTIVPLFKADYAGDLKVSAYVYDELGKPCRTPATKTVSVQAADSYLLSELNINGNNMVNFQPEKTEYTYSIPDTLEFFTVSWRVLNEAKGTTELQDLDGNALTGDVFRFADYQGVKVVRKDADGVKATYTIHFRPVASNNTASVISVDGVELTEEIKAGTHSYFIAMDNDQNVVEFAVDIPDDATDVKVYRSFYRDEIANQAESGNDFSAMVDLYSGLNIFNIDVTAADGLTVTRYRAQVFRAGYSDAYASDIQFNGASVEGFDPEITDYKIPVTSEEMKHLNVSVSSVEGKDATTNITINNHRTEGTQASGELDKEINNVVVAVKAENQFTAKYYNFVLYTPSDDNAALESLSVLGASLNEPFSEDRTEYTMKASGKPVTIQARTWEEGAKIQITADEGQVYTLGSDVNCEVLLYKGDNTIQIQVTSPNGKQTKTYTITTNVVAEMYLTDLDWTSGSYAGTGGNINRNLSNDGNPLTMNVDGEETVFEHGFGTLTNAYVHFSIEGLGFSRLTGYVGVDKENPTSAGAGFEIYYNGDTGNPAQLGLGVRYSTGNAGEFTIDFPENTKLLALWAYGSGGTAHVDWADLKLINLNAMDRPEPSKHTLKVSYGTDVMLSVNGEKQPAGGTFEGSYLEGTSVTLAFVPIMSEKEISSVQLNGKALNVTNPNKFTYRMDTKGTDETLNFQFKVANKQSQKSSSSSNNSNVSNVYGASGFAVVGETQGALAASVRSDTTVDFTVKRGSAYCFKMTVLNGNGVAPSFTVGNGAVLKTQFVTRIGNDYYYRVYAVGKPGESTGVYTTLPGQSAVKHCTVKVG